MTFNTYGLILGDGNETRLLICGF